MRPHAILFLAASLAVAASGSQSSPALPQCAVDCQEQVFSSNTTSCSSTDTTCLCSDQLFQDTLGNCATANCTASEALTAKYLSSRQCDIPIVHRYPEADAGTIFPFVLATVLFAIRIAAKSMRLGGGWGPDDYTIIIAWALGVVVFSLNVSMVHYGFGMNVWDIIPQENITQGYKRFYAFILTYKALISLAKISVCLFLLRIFQSKPFRYTTYVMIGINTAIAITWILADAFHCIPVHLSWTAWKMDEEGKCFDFVASTFANGYVNIAVDTIMVSMPVWEVIKLNLSVQKKLGVVFMFAAGLVLTAIGIVRVIVFHFNSPLVNPTYNMEAIVHWSVIECQIAIICACLPASRAVMVRLAPGLLGQSTDPSNRYKNTGSSGHGAGSRHNISKRVSYSVDYMGNGKPQRSSFVQLKDMGPEGDSHDHY